MASYSLITRTERLLSDLLIYDQGKRSNGIGRCAIDAHDCRAIQLKCCVSLKYEEGMWIFNTEGLDLTPPAVRYMCGTSRDMTAGLAMSVCYLESAH